MSFLANRKPNYQAFISCGTIHHSRARALIPFYCPVKCNEKTRSHLRQNEIYGSGATASLLACRGKQASICLDGVNKGNQKEGSLNGYKMGIETNSMYRKRHLSAAIDALKDMSLSGCLPDVITFNTIIRSMFDHGKIGQVIQFLKDQLIKGRPPCVITCTILIELVCKYCGVARALETVEDLIVEGWYPDLGKNNSMISFSFNKGNMKMPHWLSRI